MDVLFVSSLPCFVFYVQLFVDFAEAAIHFTQYLCAAQKITSRVPSISRDELKTVFSEEYQPQYSVQCLEMKTLVTTLAMAGLLEKPPTNGNALVTFKWDRIENIAFSNGMDLSDVPSRKTL